MGSVVLAALLPHVDQIKTFQAVDLGRGLRVRQDRYSAKSSWCPVDGQMGPHGLGPRATGMLGTLASFRIRSQLISASTHHAQVTQPAVVLRA